MRIIGKEEEMVPTEDSAIHTESGEDQRYNIRQ